MAEKKKQYRIKPSTCCSLVISLDSFVEDCTLIICNLLPIVGETIPVELE